MELMVIDLVIEFGLKRLIESDWALGIVVLMVLLLRQATYNKGQ